MTDTKELAGLLAKVKTIAVVGAKDRPGQPVDTVGRYLIQAGFTVLPVHPKRSGVWGLDTYPSMLDIPVPVDLVDLFRAPEHCPSHARECLSLNPRPMLFWMQSGISSPESRRILMNSTIRVVEDSCLMVEHRRLCGAGS